jgi:hypothetical protein
VDDPEAAAALASSSVGRSDIVAHHSTRAGPSTRVNSSITWTREALVSSEAASQSSSSAESQSETSNSHTGSLSSSEESLHLWLDDQWDSSSSTESLSEPETPREGMIFDYPCHGLPMHPKHPFDFHGLPLNAQYPHLKIITPFKGLPEYVEICGFAGAYNIERPQRNEPRETKASF